MTATNRSFVVGVAVGVIATHVYMNAKAKGNV